MMVEILKEKRLNKEITISFLPVWITPAKLNASPSFDFATRIEEMLPDSLSCLRRCCLKLPE